MRWQRELLRYILPTIWHLRRLVLLRSCARPGFVGRQMPGEKDKFSQTNYHSCTLLCGQRVTMLKYGKLNIDGCVAREAMRLRNAASLGDYTP